jgi:uncharacterized protein YbjT (DUF2867 family)
MQRILVTGASGVLGRFLTGAFSDAGFEVRQAVRNRDKALPGIDSVRFDYADPTTFDPALDGIEGLALIAPPLDPNAPAEVGPVIARARAAGVRHIVFVSALGVNHNEQTPLRVVEHLVMDSGIPYTILRPNFFMENFSEGFLAAGIKGQNGVFVPAGDGKTSFISVRDIAAVAVVAFKQPLECREFELTGPAALDHHEATRIITEVSGRPVKYVPLTDDQMVSGARALGMPEPAIAYVTALYGAVRAGYAAVVTREVEDVTGRKPVTFEQFAKASAPSWR